ncbi:MAG TPA: metal-sulfur cluster assembly factor [Candidatus Saccharimonadales bacterium]|nr:metal-sulfur cluster assembly factor [Candidatus Saccharimonadales bacterium]
MLISQEQIIDKLRECLDPELGLNIVDLGLVYGVNVEGSSVNVLMTLTTPGCPLDSYFTKDITSRLKSLKGISDVSVELTFEPPWNPAKMSDESMDLLGFVN